MRHGGSSQHQRVEEAPPTHVSDDSVQRVDQDKVKGGGGGGGQADLQRTESMSQLAPPAQKRKQEPGRRPSP